MTPIETSHIAAIIIAAIGAAVIIAHQWPMQKAKHEAAQAERRRVNRVRIEAEAEAYWAKHDKENVARAHFCELLAGCAERGERSETGDAQTVIMPWSGVTHMAHPGKGYDDADPKEWRAGEHT